MNLVPEGQYISPYAGDLDYWSKHINGMIVSDYSHFIRDRVLEIGCNHGVMTEIINKLYGVYSIEGMDINPEAIKMAKEFYPKRTFWVWDITVGWPLFYETIVSFHTLEHILDVQLAVDNIYNWLAPSGHAVISVPYERAYDSHYHVNYFNEESLSKLFSAFRIVKCSRDQRVDCHGNEHDVLNLIARKE